MFQQILLYHTADIDGALDTILVVSGGSSFNTSSGSTISGIPIRGDGSGGVGISVTISSGAITGVIKQLQEQDILLHILETLRYHCCCYKRWWCRIRIKSKCNYCLKVVMDQRCRQRVRWFLCYDKQITCWC